MNNLNNFLEYWDKKTPVRILVPYTKDIILPKLLNIIYKKIRSLNPDVQAWIFYQKIEGLYDYLRKLFEFNKIPLAINKSDCKSSLNVYEHNLLFSFASPDYIKNCLEVLNVNTDDFSSTSFYIVLNNTDNDVVNYTCTMFHLNEMF